MVNARLLVLALALGGATMSVAAQDVQLNNSEVPLFNPSLPLDDCIAQGSAYHGVNMMLVRAIIKVESNFNAGIRKNRNGSMDIGLGQLNSVHYNEIAKYGIAPNDLMNGCVASYVTAWHLKKKILAYGNNWYAVGAYSSTTACYNRRYSSLVRNTLRSWGVLQGEVLAVDSIAYCDAQVKLAKN